MKQTPPAYDSSSLLSAPNAAANPLVGPEPFCVALGVGFFFPIVFQLEAEEAEIFPSVPDRKLELPAFDCSDFD